MQVVALLPPELREHVIQVLGTAHAVHSALNPIELHRVIRACDAGLLILDPVLHDGLFADAIEKTITEFQVLPVLVYTSVSARSMGLVLRLSRLGVDHMVLRGIDDEPYMFRELVERMPVYPVVDLMLRELRGPMSSLPHRVNRALELLFQSPARARTSSDLAQLAGTTRRALYRLMSPAGLQPRKVIDSARLLRAYTLLRVPGSTLKETSVKLGFADPHTLSDLLREWTGHSTRSIRFGFAAEVFVPLLAAYTLRRTEDVEELIPAGEPPLRAG